MKKSPKAEGVSVDPTFYRKSNLIQFIAAICMVILAVMSFTTPFLCVQADDRVPDEILEERKTTREVSFSLLDVITDIKAEYDLHMEHKDAMEEIESQEEYDQDAVDLIKYDPKMPDNGGNFSKAASTAILNAQYSYDARVAECEEAIANGANPSEIDITHHDLRIRFNNISGHILFTYCAVPLLLAVVLSIVAVVALIKSIVRVVRPGIRRSTAGTYMMILIPLAAVVMSYVLTDPNFGYSYSVSSLVTFAGIWVVSSVLDVLGSVLNNKASKINRPASESAAQE